MAIVHNTIAALELEGEPESEAMAALNVLSSFAADEGRVAVIDRKMTEAVYETAILIAMAGQAAEAGMRGGMVPDWEGGSADDRAAIDNAIVDLARHDTVRVGPEPEFTPYGTKAYFDSLWFRASLMVRSEWAAVKAVATELLAHETLDGNRVREVIAATQPEPPPLSPLVLDQLERLDPGATG